MFAIENNVKTNYPQIWVETYLFIFAVALIIAAAAFSIVARAANLSMWYPLIILLIPVIIAFITTRRRNGYYARLSHVSTLVMA